MMQRDESVAGLRRYDITPDHAQILWEQGHQLPDWPSHLRHKEQWDAYVESFEVAATLASGQLQTVWAGDALCGFISTNRVDERFLPDGCAALEGGTFLFPMHRGTGLNATLKRGWVARSFADPAVTHVVFVIPSNNMRAQRALEKLGWAWKMSKPGRMEPFSNLAKRRTWEQGAECVVYSLEKSDGFKDNETCHTPP